MDDMEQLGHIIGRLAHAQQQRRAEHQVLRMDIAIRVFGWNAADMRLLGDQRDVPDWPSDDGTALHVVRRLREQGYNWTASDAPSWTFWRPGEINPVTGYGATIAEAICNAAMRVLGVPGYEE